MGLWIDFSFFVEMLNPDISFYYYYVSLKVITQKYNLPINFFETFPESFVLSTVSKKKNNKNEKR